MILFLRHHNGAAYFLNKEGNARAICSNRMVDQVMLWLDPSYDVFDYDTGHFVQADENFPHVPELQ